MENIKINYDEFVKETDKSWGLSWSDINEILWFPKSQCTIDKILKSIEIPQWLYDKKLAKYD